MPYVGERVEARTALIAKAAGPPYWRYSGRMSGVFVNMFGRIEAAAGPASSRL